jgi:hypothetical protein
VYHRLKCSSITAGNSLGAHVDVNATVSNY